MAAQRPSSPGGPPRMPDDGAAAVSPAQQRARAVPDWAAWLSAAEGEVTAAAATAAAHGPPASWAAFLAACPLATALAIHRATTTALLDACRPGPHGAPCPVVHTCEDDADLWAAAVAADPTLAALAPPPQPPAAAVNAWPRGTLLPVLLAHAPAALADGPPAAWHARMLHVVDGLLAHAPHSAPFAQPVAAADAPGYAAVVTCPVDLGTLRARVLARDAAFPGSPAGWAAFEAALRTMFANARAYNTRVGHPVVVAAAALERHLVALLRALPPLAGPGTDGTGGGTGGGGGAAVVAAAAERGTATPLAPLPAAWAACRFPSLVAARRAAAVRALGDRPFVPRTPVAMATGMAAAYPEYAPAECGVPPLRCDHGRVHRPPSTTAAPPALTVPASAVTRNIAAMHRVRALRRRLADDPRGPWPPSVAAGQDGGGGEGDGGDAPAVSGVMADTHPPPARAAVRLALRRAAATTCLHAGFEEADQGAVDVLEDVAAGFLARLCRHVRATLDARPAAAQGGTLAAAGRAARDLTRGGLPALGRYWVEDVRGIGCQLVALEAAMARKVERRATALADAAVAAAAAAAAPAGADVTAAGDVALEAALHRGHFGVGDDDLGLDLLGLRAFGVADMDVPAHLLADLDAADGEILHSGRVAGGHAGRHHGGGGGEPPLSWESQHPQQHHHHHVLASGATHPLTRLDELPPDLVFE